MHGSSLSRAVLGRADKSSVAYQELIELVFLVYMKRQRKRVEDWQQSEV